MLAQTNLQLYGQMAAAGWSSDRLAAAREAYDLARSTFHRDFRPSHKPFLCHLVGTASAMVAWGQTDQLVIASLLHSLYLFGDFGDGDRGASERRRRHVRDAIGVEAEALIYRYTVSPGGFEVDDPDVTRMRLADALDELTDAGPRYSPSKEIGGLLSDESKRQACLAAAEQYIGLEAVHAFRLAFDELDMAMPAHTLVTTDRSFHRLDPGCLALRRGPWTKRMLRWKRSISRRIAS